MNVYEMGLQFRADLLARERAASVRVLQTYAAAWQDIERATQQLLAVIGTERPTPGQLARLSQYAQLLDALEAAVTSAAGTTSGVISREQLAALESGTGNARDLIRAAMPDEWVTFLQPSPMDQLTAAVGLAGDGAPLDAHLLKSGRAVADQVMAEIQRAIVAGLDARETARRVKALWGKSATAALTLARTEMMQAYRESSRAQYQANSDVVRGWQWLCARSTKTCPACLALDGTIFDLAEPQPAHMRCRCTMIPVLRNQPPPQRQSGSDWLAQQDKATQQALLGDKGYAAYSNGASLSDFVAYRDDARWGRQALWKVPEQ